MGFSRKVFILFTITFLLLYSVNHTAFAKKTPKSAVECNDKIDNDGDGLIDYKWDRKLKTNIGDQGCESKKDNDETNCGDGVCEGGEGCSSCETDCGACIRISAELATTCGVKVDDVFPINTGIKDVKNLYGYDFSLYYDTAFLDSINVTEGSFLQGSGDTLFQENEVNDTYGQVWAFSTLLSSASSANGDGILATVYFKAVACGESLLDLRDTILVDNTATRVPHDGVDLALNVTLKGDVNGDGTVDILDSAIVGAAYGSQPGDDNWDERADINCDGVVDDTDLDIVSAEFGNSC